ncbi:MAG: DUF2344 domain-containing protein [Chloroflexi bacterium]|nr:DUF2344 domain-containing protein [Chloroflexota bacterium]
MKVQRLRVTFGRGEPVKYISHLDLMRFWERVLRRAGIPLAYSKGANPTAQLSLAAPLPVGVLSSCELMDVFLEERVTPAELVERLGAQTVPGIELLGAREVGVRLPSLQSQVRWAEYRVEVLADGRSRDEVQATVARLLAADSLPWEHRREEQVRRYDLRKLVLDVWVEEPPGETLTLGMRLRTDQEASGRPEQVAAALGFAGRPLRIERSKLQVGERPRADVP